MLKDRIRSFKYAIDGIITMFKSEPNAKIHLVVLLIVVICGFLFSLSATEWCLLFLSFAIVLGAEAMNTAIESLTDLVSPDPHPLAGQAKDLAAGAVLLCTLGSVTVGLIIFLPKIWALFFF